MSGISLLLKELDIEYKIKTRKDKQNFINFNLKNGNRNNSSFINKTKKKSDEVWKNCINENFNSEKLWKINFSNEKFKPQQNGN